MYTNDDISTLRHFPARAASSPTGNVEGGDVKGYAETVERTMSKRLDLKSSGDSFETRRSINHPQLGLRGLLDGYGGTGADRSADLIMVFRDGDATGIKDG